MKHIPSGNLGKEVILLTFSFFCIIVLVLVSGGAGKGHDLE